jgi:MFS transporter, FSR family, fosmidomycin resistance protein
MSYTSEEKRILAVTSAAHFLTHLYELAFPAIALTLRDDLGWTLADVLRLSFLMYLLFGLGALPAGLLTDRWRARWVLAASACSAGIGCALVALSRTQAQFTVALALVGLSISAYHPAGMSLLSRCVRRRGGALGLNGVFGNLGSATAPFIGGLLAYAFGWRAAYAGLGGLGIAAAALTLLLPIDETSVEAAAARPAASRDGSNLESFGILCVAMMLAGLSYRGVSLLLPATFEGRTTFLAAALEHLRFLQVAKVRNLAATAIASGVYMVGVIGQIVGGHLADRHDLRKLYLLFHACSLPFVLAMGALNEWALVASAALYIFFGLGMQPIENSMVARFTPMRWRSTSYGIKFVLNFGVGALGVYGVTALHRDDSFALVYLAVAGFVVLVCGVALLLWWRTRGGAVRNEPAMAVLS